MKYEFEKGVVLAKGDPPVYSIEADHPVTIDPIWGLSAGDKLEALVSLSMEDGAREQAFTAGKRYEVIRVLPIRDPAAAIVIDDTGHENYIEASLLSQFRHVGP